MTRERTQDDHVEWEVLNPMAEYETLVSALAPRLTTLNDRKVGLFWNGKPAGDVLLAAIETLLAERFENVKFTTFNLYISVGPENVKQMAERCDAVIAAIGD